MKTIRTEVEITADGGLRLLSPLPIGLKPGRAQIMVIVNDDSIKTAQVKRPKLVASPEMLAARKTALDVVRKLDPYRTLADPGAWQREIRQDRTLPFRE
jgi:hypothetical protein